MSVKPAKTRKAALSAFTRTAIRDAAQKVRLHAVGLSVGDGKAYEAWALMEIASRFKAAGKSVIPRDSAGNKTPYFRVGGGPALIPSTTKNPHKHACYFVVNDVWELHSSLRHAGSSGDSHELDVSMVAHDSADAIRHGPTGGAYVGRTFFGIELKEYGLTAKLPKGYARALLGVAFDISPGQFMEPIEVTIQGRKTHVWSPLWPSRTRFLLATTTRLTEPTTKLLKHYRIRYSERADIASGSMAFDCAFGGFLR